MAPKEEKVIIIKLNTDREETWRYEGHVLEFTPHSMLIEAYFNREDLSFHGVILKNNDRFVERYYENRWYNIFEIHDREDDHLKAWYCNVTMPAEFSEGQIAYVDLALDLLVYPDNGFLILDEDEFEALDISEANRIKARQALDELINKAKNRDIAATLKPKEETQS